MTPQELVIATPTDGDPSTAMVSWGYMNARERLIRGGAITISATTGFTDDLARARSRMAAHALDQPNWKWLLWWDDDCVPQDPHIVERMLACAIQNGHDFIMAPYPRKRMPVSMCYVPMEEDLRAGKFPIVNDCIEIRAGGFGFAMTSRKCLETMTAHYADEWFSDVRHKGPTREVVALFKQVHTPPLNTSAGRFRELMSEDHSFCYRWRAMGGKVQLFVGEGAPIFHLGGYLYKGDRADLGSVL